MINVEEIKLSPTLSIWKARFDTKDIDKMVDICKSTIQSQPDVKNDGYINYNNQGLKVSGFVDDVIPIKNELDSVRNYAINACITIFNTPFNEIRTDVWVNVVRISNPVQKNYKSNGKLIFHNHVDLNILNKRAPPNYTFVCYIQMPDNLSGDDGVLFMEDIDKRIYRILPEVGDIIIMDGGLPHVPNDAPNSTKDRLVLAGNVRMDFLKLKSSLI